LWIASRGVGFVYFVLFVDTSSQPPFTAVLFAGGKSTRMGCDKATVLIDGQPLWRRQLTTLRALQPHEFFISGKPDGPYAGAGFEILADNFPGLGPLAGLEAALRRASHPLVLVLAIDLPEMTAEFLSSLVRSPGLEVKGCVPQFDDWFEPLAAVYPTACLPLAQECLRAADHSMQRFVRVAVDQGFIKVCRLDQNERPLFKNINRPGDLVGEGDNLPRRHPEQSEAQ